MQTERAGLCAAAHKGSFIIVAFKYVAIYTFGKLLSAHCDRSSLTEEKHEIQNIRTETWISASINNLHGKQKTTEHWWCRERVWTFNGTAYMHCQVSMQNIATNFIN